jgi:hypothetical protein
MANARSAGQSISRRAPLPSPGASRHGTWVHRRDLQICLVEHAAGTATEDWRPTCAASSAGADRDRKPRGQEVAARQGSGKAQEIGSNRRLVLTLKRGEWDRRMGEAAKPAEFAGERRDAFAIDGSRSDTNEARAGRAPLHLPRHSGGRQNIGTPSRQDGVTLPIPGIPCSTCPLPVIIARSW